MPVTDRDNYIIATALSYAIEIIKRMPEELREQGELDDMEKILVAICGEDFAGNFRETALDLIEGREELISEIAHHKAMAAIEARDSNVVPLHGLQPPEEE